jgi:glycosyltransferase involved in cell wall biosynthesis
MVPHVDVLLVALANIRQDARTLNLARALSRAGYNVGVIASGTVDDLEVFSWPDPGGSAFTRWRSLNAFVKNADIKAKVVFGMDLFALQAARSKAKKCRCPLFYDMREFYFALGPLEGRGWKQRIIAWHERALLRHVDQVLVSGYLDAKIVNQRFALKKHPHVLLNTPPWKERLQSTYLRDVFSIPATATIVLYQGVVHHGRGLAPFMQAMHQREYVHLCVVGDGPAKQDLQQQAQRLGVAERVHWHNAVDYDALHPITCSADVGLCLIEPVSASYRYALPNKLFEYMMARVPVLATDLPALHEQLVRIPAGMLVHADLRVADILDALDRLLLPATYTAMQEAAARVRTVAYEQQVDALIELLP